MRKWRESGWGQREFLCEKAETGLLRERKKVKRGIKPFSEKQKENERLEKI